MGEKVIEMPDREAAVSMGDAGGRVLINTVGANLSDELVVGYAIGIANAALSAIEVRRGPLYAHTALTTLLQDIASRMPGAQLRAASNVRKRKGMRP